MIDRHKANPVTFRPPEGDRTWLYAHAKATGQSVGAILTEALAEYRAHRRDLSGYEVTRKDGNPSNLDITNLEIRKSRKS